MESHLDLAIREKLSSYLVGKISLEEFEDWFVLESWNVAQSNNSNAVNLVYEIELWLAEYSDGHWSEKQLKNYLVPLVTDYKVEVGYDRIIVMDSNAKVELFPLLSASFDI
jgi:hypothetical protein